MASNVDPIRAVSVIATGAGDPIGRLPYEGRFAFLAGLMFVYADLAAATPFSNNIEGLVYLRPEFTTRDVFVRVASEAVVYSVLFGAVAGWLLF